MKAIDCINRWGTGTLRIVLVLFCLGGVRASEIFAKQQAPPNILLIYVDDLGYGDVGVYGSSADPLVDTPNIDRIAATGMRFTQGYAPAPLCSSSRAAMLTGKGVATLGFEFVTKYPEDERAMEDPEWLEKHKSFPLVPPPYTLNLPLEEVTLAEALKERGYATGIVGKWHIAAHHLKYKGWSPTHGPKQQGFDWAEETFGTHPYSEVNEAPAGPGEYPSDDLTDKAVEFITMEHDAPFFLMASFYFVHTPMKKNIPWLYREIEQKVPKGTSADLIHYAVNVTLMDHYVGQLMDALEHAGQRENTLILFTSDNGGHPKFANNGPFRGSKWNLYEGGIRVPIIASLPGVTPFGSICEEPVSQIDFMPTFLELAGGVVTESFQGDGRSLLPLLRDEKEVRQERALLWHFPYYHPEGEHFFSAEKEIGIHDGKVSQTRPHSALRWGDYKLIHYYESGKNELYNLVEDPSESIDLGEIESNIRQKLWEKMRQMLDEADARLPVPKHSM